MAPIDIPSIESQARELRAAEIQRLNGIFVERAALVTQLAAETTAISAHAFSEMLRPFFAWNPQPRHAPLTESLKPALNRMNETARALFSWNPQDHRS